MARHNTPTHIGWRRTTFHWELNIYTALFFLWIYYAVLPVSYRPLFLYTLGPFLLYDSSRYYIFRQDLAGAPYTFPLVTIIAMLIRPVRFWAELGTMARRKPSLNDS